MKQRFLIILFLFLTKVGSSQDFNSVVKIGGNMTNNAYDFVVDGVGNSYTVGSFSDTCDIDPGAGVFNVVPVSGTLNNCYLNKFSSTGSFFWGKTFNCVGTRVSVDGSGNVYLAGSFGGPDSVDFDPGPGVFNLISTSPTIPDAFVLKLDAAGNFLWVKSIIGPIIYGVASDSVGSVYASGQFSVATDFDPGAGVANLSAVGSADAFILKLKANGNFGWVKQIGNTGIDGIIAAQIDAQQNLYVGGRFEGTVDFDPGGGTFLLTATGSADAFVAKLDTTGTLAWAKNAGDYCYGVGSDQLGNVYMTGYFFGARDFDPGAATNTLVSQGANDAFLLKLTSAGNFVYAKQIGGTGGDNGFRAYVRQGNCYWAGTFENTVDLDPGMGATLASSLGGFDTYITKLDSLGNFIWGRHIGGASNEQVMDMYADSSDDLTLFGFFQDSTSFDIGNPLGDLYGQGIDGFLATYTNDSCSGLILLIDTVVHASCSGPGVAYGHALNGLQPYSFSWNTTPATIDSFAVFTNAGIYQLTVTDANGCSKSTSVIVNGPSTTTGFDLNSNLLATDYRVGFQSTIWVDAYNAGCVQVDGSLLVVLDTALTFISSVPPPLGIVGDTLVWDFYDLTFDSLHITPQITVQNSVWSAIGDTVNLDVILDPVAGDLDPANNVKSYAFPVINGYDPNEKSVYPKGACAPGFVKNTEMLTYAVRFQNTGNASAVNIYVLDTLDADLDLSTVRIVGNSHSLVAEVLAGNVLRFRFNNIMLPDSTSNEPMSHGYVIFEIKPNAGLANGIQITNDVGIYFDYNLPVYTNTVSNTINDGVVNTSISLSGSTFTAAATGVTYQWVDCDLGYTIIPGATAQTFTASSSGNYAVIINDGCYADTSNCLFYLGIGIEELIGANKFMFYPNPSDNAITIITHEPQNVFITNMLGEIILNQHVENNSSIDISKLANGLYFINSEGAQPVKLIKQ